MELAIDDFSVTPHGTVLPPNLTISDVSLVEGNSGTTSFNFTVSLSSPAGPGGVTFDIATADGTAQDDNPATEDNDYVRAVTDGSNNSCGQRRTVYLQRPSQWRHKCRGLTRHSLSTLRM